MEFQEKDIKKRVEDRLNRDDRIRSGQISVDVENNNVILKGKVKNHYQLRAAQENAYMAAGVRNVDNLLTIEPSATIRKPDDMEVESNIRNMLLWDNRIDSTETEILVDRGQVELNGSVDSFWEKQLAENIAQSVEGVLEVQNNLVVNSRHESNDELIADRVYEAIDASAVVNANDINIAVNDGMVTLTGQVQSYLAANEAHDALLYIPGVRGIVNNITIG